MPRSVRVEAFNSTAIKVSWRPPRESEQNGIIRGYQIQYRQVDEDDQPVSREVKSYDVQDGTKKDVIIDDLIPDSYYSVTVAAYTRKGDGEHSRSKKAKTNGAGNNYNALLSSSFSMKSMECLPKNAMLCMQIECMQHAK